MRRFVRGLGKLRRGFLHLLASALFLSLLLGSPVAHLVLHPRSLLSRQTKRRAPRRVPRSASRAVFMAADVTPRGSTDATGAPSRVERARVATRRRRKSPPTPIFEWGHPGRFWSFKRGSGGLGQAVRGDSRERSTRLDGSRLGPARFFANLPLKLRGQIRHPTRRKRRPGAGAPYQFDSADRCSPVASCGAALESPANLIHIDPCKWPEPQNPGGNRPPCLPSRSCSWLSPSCWRPSSSSRTSA